MPRTTKRSLARSRIPALSASTLVLLSSALALAATSNSSTQTPPAPETRVGCPVPTLAQCQDPSYLERDRCGVLQLKNNWTCSELLQAEMFSLRETQGEVYSAVPKTLAAEGAGKVVKLSAEPDKRHFTPDLTSYQSRQAARDYQPANPVLGIDKYAMYEKNGAQVETCEEYAFEKYLDISEFTRRVGGTRGDHLEAVKIAFGPASEVASIGTRHLSNPALKGRDGEAFGTLLTGQRPRSAFADIPLNPPVKGHAPVPGAPVLSKALLKMPGAGAYIAKIHAQPTKVPNTWAQHKKYKDELLYIPPNGPLPIAAAPPQPDDPGGLKAALGTTSDQVPKRKRIAKELDELYDLQERFKARWDDWARLNELYRGSGWTDAELDADDDDDSNGGGGFGLVGGFQAAPPAPQPANTIIAQPQPPPPSLPQQPSFPINNNHSQETVARRKVLQEMMDLMDQANEEGCFEPGMTACDWSPKLFVNAVRNTFADEQDADFEKCESFTGGSIQYVKNLNVSFVDDVAYPEYECIITSGSTITAQELDQMMGKVAECRVKRAQYVSAKSNDQAKANVAKIPELFDDDGDFKAPGIRKHRDEEMGGQRFALGYGYDFGFSMKADHAICQLDLESHAQFNAYARVFGKEKYIVDAEARVSSKEKKAHAHAKILGKDIFTPVDKDWTVDAKAEWNIADGFSYDNSYTLFASWFVIGVIPVKLEAGIAGEAGVDFGIEAEAQGFDNDSCPSARIGGKVEPYAKIDGYLEAGIDVVIASVGVRGSLTIVRASLPFTAGVGVELKEGGFPGPAAENFVFFADTRMDMKVATLSGALSVYGQVGFCPLCVRGEKELVSFEGPSVDKTLFHHKYDVNLRDLGIALALD